MDYVQKNTIKDLKCVFINVYLSMCIYQCVFINVYLLMCLYHEKLI